MGNAAKYIQGESCRDAEDSYLAARTDGCPGEFGFTTHPWSA
jgi:hypothetical protein